MAKPTQNLLLGCVLHRMPVIQRCVLAHERNVSRVLDLRYKPQGWDIGSSLDHSPNDTESPDSNYPHA